MLAIPKPLRSRPAAILALLAVFFVGCHGQVDDTLEETTEDIYPITSDAVLTLRNADGSIRVYGADTTNLTVQVIRRAYSQARLNAIAAHVKRDGNAVTINTSYPPAPGRFSLADRSGTVEYNIVVPQTCTIAELQLTNGEILIDGLRGPSVKATLVNGRLTAKNCFTDAHLQTVHAGIDLFYDWWEAKAFTAVTEARDGNMRISIPSDASVNLRAHTDRGNIGNAYAAKADRNRGGIRDATVTLGSEAQSQIEMRTGDGNIRIDEPY